MLLPRYWHLLCRVAVVLAIGLLFSASQSLAQAQPAPDQGDLSKLPGFENLNQYPHLLPALGDLAGKLQHDVEFPAERSHSDILPLLPPSTVAYMALPNYGDSVNQARVLLEQELKQSPDFRQWWTQGNMRSIGPAVQNDLAKFALVSGYLGDEIVASFVLNGREPDLLIIAPIRKAGLRPILERVEKELSGNATFKLRVVDSTGLIAIRGNRQSNELLMLVRPDFVIAATNPSVLREFNSRLDHGERDFATTPFAQRILESYASGVTVMGAVDLQKLIGLIPRDPGFATLQQSGFADLKFLVWEHRVVGGKTASQAEVSFTGRRHGVAAWLAKPAPLAGLDFVSPKAMIAASLLLKDPGDV